MSQSKISRSRSRRRGSQSGDGEAKPGNSQSQEPDSDAGARPDIPLDSGSAASIRVGDRVRIIDNPGHHCDCLGKETTIIEADHSIEFFQVDLVNDVGARMFFPQHCLEKVEVVTGEVITPELEPVSYERIEKIKPNGWIHSTDGMNLNPSHYQPAPLALATPESILAKYGFVDSSDFATPRDIIEEYRGWRIALTISNGGILAVDLFKGDKCWGRPTEEEFNYLDQESIVNQAKGVIDQIEAALAPATSPDAFDDLISDLKSELETTTLISAMVMMSAAEARSCVDSIKGHIENARKLLLDLYEREGWKSLGYNSWRECAIAEFGESKSQLYRELEAAKIERNISQIGEIGSIKESHLRPLVKLEPEQQRKVWEEAVTTAPNGKVTAAHIQEIAEKRLPKENEPPTLEAIHSLYAQIGRIGRPAMPKKSQPNAFKVEVEGAGPPFPLFFQGRKDAWAYWQKNSQKLLEVAARYPMQLNPAASCMACQHRHLFGDGSEFECGARGSSWTCAVTRDWAVENDGCDRFKPYPQTQPLADEVVCLGKQIYPQPAVGPQELEDEVRGEVVDTAIAPADIEPEQRILIDAFELTISQHNKLAIHAHIAGLSMVGYLQKLIEELPEA